MWLKIFVVGLVLGLSACSEATSTSNGPSEREINAAWTEGKAALSPPEKPTEPKYFDCLERKSKEGLSSSLEANGVVDRAFLECKEFEADYLKQMLLIYTSDRDGNYKPLPPGIDEQKLVADLRRSADLAKRAQLIEAVLQSRKYLANMARRAPNQ